MNENGLYLDSVVSVLRPEINPSMSLGFTLWYSQTWTEDCGAQSLRLCADHLTRLQTILRRALLPHLWAARTAFQGYRTDLIKVRWTLFIASLFCLECLEFPALMWGPEDLFLIVHCTGVRQDPSSLRKWCGRAEVRGPQRGGLTCPSLCARPFNPELHPSAGTWQWQGITKISGDCWVVWHLSLVMKYRKSSCPCYRFPNSKSFEEYFLYFLSWSWSSLKTAVPLNSTTYHPGSTPPCFEEIIV